MPGDGDPFAVRALVGIEGVSLFDPSGETLHDAGALGWFGARVLQANRDLLAWPADVSGFELDALRSDGEWVEIAFRLHVPDDAGAPLASLVVLDGLGALQRIENVVGATTDTDRAPAPR